MLSLSLVAVEETLLAWDRDNPVRQRFTRKGFVNTSSLRLDQLLSVRQNQHLITSTPRPRIPWDTYSPTSLNTGSHSGGGGACWDTDRVWFIMECLTKWWKNKVSLKARAYVKDYCKRNGLLTLSVFAVVTGCVLGFVLRTLNLSTQVWMAGNLTGGNVTMAMALDLTDFYYLSLPG